MAAPASRRGLTAFCLLALAAANLIAYAPSLFAPFVFDDFVNIAENPAVREAGAGRAPLLDLVRPHLRSRRPLAYLSFALNLRGFGLDPWPFHLVNLAIHILNSWLVFALILTLLPARLKVFERDEFQSRIPQASSLMPHASSLLLLPALAGALLWSLHPVQVQAVTYIVQRMTSGATLFYLLALLLALRAREQNHDWPRVGFALAALGTGLLGFLCKEILITLPLAWLLVELGLLADPRPRRRPLLVISAVCLLSYGVIFALFAPQLGREIEHYAPRFAASPEQRLLTQPRVILHYLSLLAWPDPSRLNLDPEWTVSTGLFHPWTTAPAIIALAAMLGLSLRWIQNRPFLALAGLFFLLALLPESIFPLDLAFEHRLYLSSAALLGLIGAAWVWPGPRPRLRLALFALAAILLLTLSFSRNLTWADDVRLWRDTVKKSPGSSRAWFNLAKHLTDLGQYPEAVLAGRQSLKILPGQADALSNLGGAYLGLRQFAAARQSFDDALKCDPLYEIAKAGLDLTEVLEKNPQLRSPFPPPAAAEDPDGAGKLYRRGYSRLRDGRSAEAFRDLEQALKLRPQFSEAAALLAEAKQVRAGPSP